MSEAHSPAPDFRPRPDSPPRRRTRAALAIASVLLAGISLFDHRRELRARGPAERFAREFTLGLRRSSEAETLRVPLASDLLADIVADAALQDAEEGGPTRPLDPKRSSSGTAEQPRGEKELSAARNVLLDAVSARPGSAAHRFLLGRIALQESSFVPPVPRSEASLEKWRKPLQAAAAAAPGLDTIWGTLSRAYLDAWPRLSPAIQRETAGVFRRAFLNSSVVLRDFPLLRETLGPEADALLPEDAGPLAAALESLDGRADVPATFSLLQRLDRAKRRDRAVRLAEIERLHRLGDGERLHHACESFAATHPAGDFDDTAGRREAARVLELWPHVKAGSWPHDRRAELVRFFLDGRELDVRPTALSRALEPLSGVPGPVRAQVRLLNGDTVEAEALAAARGGAGESGWTPYFVRLSRVQLARGLVRQAGESLSRLEPEAREDCDALLARRDLARAAGDAATAQALSRRIGWLRVSARSRREWGGGERLALCVTPEELRAGAVTIEIQVERPAIVAFGWDGGRSGLASVSRGGRLKAPFPSAAGFRIFSLEAIVGGPVRLGEAHPRDTREGAPLAGQEGALRDPASSEGGRNRPVSLGPAIIASPTPGTDISEATPGAGPEAWRALVISIATRLERKCKAG